MADEHDELDDGGQPRMVQMSRADIRALEKKAKAADESAAKASVLERKLALRDAGIPATGLGRLFEKAYDGDLDVDAIRNAAAEYGIFDQTTTPPPAEEMAAHQRMADASAGAPGAPPADINAALLGATNEQELMAVVRKYDLKLPTRGPF